MAHIIVLGGDIEAGRWEIGGSISAGTTMDKFAAVGWFRRLSIVLGDFAGAEILTEDRHKRLAGMAGWGFLGLIALGPVGAVGGLILGANKREVIFEALLNDGRRFVGRTDATTFARVQAIIIEGRGPAPSQPAGTPDHPANAG